MPTSSQIISDGCSTVHHCWAENIEPTFEVNDQLVFEDYLLSEPDPRSDNFPRNDWIESYPYDHGEFRPVG